MSEEKETILGKAVEASKSSGEIKFATAENMKELEKYYERKQRTDSLNKAILESIS